MPSQPQKTTQSKKRNNVRPTKLQRETARQVIENGLSASQAIIAAGGSPTYAHNPHRVTNAPGYKVVLAEYGLTEELITTALVEDIKAKPANRVQELKLGAEILKMKVDEGDAPKTTVNNFFYQPRFQAHVKAFEEGIKHELAHGIVPENSQTEGAN